MSAALGHVGIDRQSIEELSFAEMEDQHAELLPSRTVLSMLKSIGTLSTSTTSASSSTTSHRYSLGLINSTAGAVRLTSAVSFAKGGTALN